MNYRKYSEKNLKIEYKWISTIVLILVISFSFVSCRNSKNELNILTILKKEYDGKWSVSSKEGCVLLSVTGSGRLDLNPDSVDHFIDQIDLLTTNFEKDRCLYFEHKIVLKQGVLQQVQSTIYIIR